MIGPRCKRGDALSRGVLIARALLISVSPPRAGGRWRISLCGPQGTRRAPGGRNAAHRSAALAAGARPVPFRTRKLSRPAPMVLRGKPVGEQGAADRWTAFHRGEGPGGAIPRGPFPFRSRESSGPVPKLSWGIFGSANLWPPYVEQSSFRYVRAVLILIGNLLLFGVAGCGNDRCAPGSISSSHPYGRARIPSPAIRP